MKKKNTPTSSKALLAIKKLPNTRFQRVQFDLPTRIAPGTTTGLYVPTQPVMRPGADDHKKFKSKGF